MNFDNFYRFHRDHRMTAEAVFDAVYPAAGSDAYFTDLMDEGFVPHQIKGMWFFGTENPDLFIDISDTIEDKIAALREHVGQFNDVEGIEKHIRERAEEAGKNINVKYAESFRSIYFK